MSGLELLPWYVMFVSHIIVYPTLFMGQQSSPGSPGARGISNLLLVHLRSLSKLISIQEPDFTYCR